MLDISLPSSGLGELLGSSLDAADTSWAEYRVKAVALSGKTARLPKVQIPSVAYMRQ